MEEAQHFVENKLANVTDLVDRNKKVLLLIAQYLNIGFRIGDSNRPYSNPDQSKTI